MAYSKLYLFLGLNLYVILYSQVLADIHVSPTLTLETNLPSMVDQVNDDQISKLKKYFRFLDTDENDFINNEELESLFRSFFEIPNDLALQTLVNRFDVDKNGMIDFPEFLTLIAPKMTNKELKQAFHLSDKDHMTNEEVDEIIRMTNVDVDGNGQINSEETKPKL